VLVDVHDGVGRCFAGAVLLRGIYLATYPQDLQRQVKEVSDQL
jgi:hypothetical protein